MFAGERTQGESVAGELQPDDTKSSWPARVLFSVSVLPGDETPQSVWPGFSSAPPSRQCIEVSSEDVLMCQEP